MDQELRAIPIEVPFLPPRLNSQEALDLHLDALVERDQRLARVRDFAGTVEPRLATPGFAGMAKVICGQQLSVSSARAIWARIEAIKGATNPTGYLALEEAVIRAAGFSSGKHRTVRVLAEAIASGLIDLEALESLPATEAIATLCTLRGIGPWTAEVYLMFCTQHPDVFPSGDLALQKAVAHALGLPDRPNTKQLVEISQAWAPHRSAAALLFWRYFAVLRDREGILL